MKNGKCPKCGSASVYSKTNGIGYGPSNGRVNVYASMLTSPSQSIAYVCTTCGYFEDYIVDPAKLAEVAKAWQKVPAEAQ